MISKLPPFTLVYFVNPDRAAEGGGTPAQPPEQPGGDSIQTGDPEPPGDSVTTGDPDVPAGSTGAAMTQPGDPPPPGGSTARGITDTGGPGVPASAGDTAQNQIEAVGRAAPELAESLKSLNLNPNLQQTLLCTSFAQSAVGVNDEQAVETLRPVVADLQRGEAVLTVGLWDLDTRSGQLPQIINLINHSQPLFTFFEIQGAPLPTALTGRPERIREWVHRELKKRNKRMTKTIREELGEMGDNFIANEFYKHAKVVYKSLGVDYLVGVTQSMVAGADSEGPFWDHFSASQGRTLVISTYDLRRYAREAGRPFEVALGMLVVAQLLVATSSRLGFHDDTGCVFDYNDDRVSIVKCIRDLKIEDDCLSMINKKYRPAALAMFDALRSYEGGAAEAPGQEEEVDYDYWLNELDKLGEE
ncbi:MAG TPA: hypothetical protein VN256_11490 [Pyrinomonadaceae bacterium]|nr:hypothetical protein [Pyrinomonadaceae bacterium]